MRTAWKPRAFKFVEEWPPEKKLRLFPAFSDRAECRGRHAKRQKPWVSAHGSSFLTNEYLPFGRFSCSTPDVSWSPCQNTQQRTPKAILPLVPSTNGEALKCRIWEVIHHPMNGWLDGSEPSQRRPSRTFVLRICPLPAQFQAFPVGRYTL